MRLPVPRALVAGAAVLAAVAGCSEQADPDVPAPPSPTPLSASQARAALLTTSFLGAPWQQVSVSRPPENRLLGGTASEPDCQQVLTLLQTGNVLLQTPVTSADALFEGDGSELAYRVGAYTRSGAEDGLALLKRLPQNCQRFGATLTDGHRALVETVQLSTPDAGNEHAGMTVTVSAELGGIPATYTADVAAVRMGSNVLSLTNGGLEGVSHPTTEQAVESGAERLKQVIEGETPDPLPSLIEAD